MTRFVHALRAATTPVIAEIKPSTGAGEDLMRGRGPEEILRSYHDAGVACLSVVTGRWFGGSLDLLRDIAIGSKLPVLQKDFIVRESQLTMARELGASAVLLTAQLLPACSLRHLVGQALALDLTPFVEVTTEDEVTAIPNGTDCVIAVNNKNIRKRESGPSDLERSVRLLPAVLASGTRCPVSASGIDEPPQAARLLAAGYVGLLIGTALLRAVSPRAWLDELARRRIESGPEGRS